MHGSLIDVCACGIAHRIARRRRDGFSQMDRKLRATLRLCKDVLIAGARQYVIEHQIMIIRAGLGCDLQQVIEVSARLDKKPLLAPAIRVGRRNELFRINGLRRDDRRIGESIGDLIVGASVVVQVVDILCPASLFLILVQIVANDIDVVADRSGMRILIDGHAEIDVRSIF